MKVASGAALEGWMLRAQQCWSVPYSAFSPIALVYVKDTCLRKHLCFSLAHRLACVLSSLSYFLGRCSPFAHVSCILEQPILEQPSLSQTFFFSATSSFALNLKRCFNGHLGRKNCLKIPRSHLPDWLYLLSIFLSSHTSTAQTHSPKLITFISVSRGRLVFHRCHNLNFSTDA